jgi:hypothetical protein
MEEFSGVACPDMDSQERYKMVFRAKLSGLSSGIAWPIGGRGRYNMVSEHRGSRSSNFKQYHLICITHMQLS